MNPRIIPIIDMYKFHDSRSEMLHDLRIGCKNGIFVVKNHIIDMDIVKHGEESLKKFFTELSLDTKLTHSYLFKEGMKGYITEIGKFPVNVSEQYFDIGLNNMAVVRELPRFKPFTNLSWHEFNNLAERLMRYISLTLGEAPDFFEDPRCREKCSVLSGIYSVSENKERIEERTAKLAPRLNVFTLLLIKKELRVEILDNEEWLPIAEVEPESVVVFVGDILDHITKGVYSSPSYRISNKLASEMLSMFFFHNVQHDFSMTPLSQFSP